MSFLATHRLPDLLDVDSALARDLLRRYETLQPFHRGGDHVQRIVGPEALRQDVLDAGLDQHFRLADLGAGDADGASVQLAARDLGASAWTIFRTIIFPLSLPGVVVGAIFVSVMVLGEFATASALSGRKVNLLGNIIVTQVGSLKWAFAAVVGVILTAVMAVVITGLLRIVNLRREL